MGLLEITSFLCEVVYWLIVECWKPLVVCSGCEWTLLCLICFVIYCIGHTSQIGLILSALV